MVDLGLGKSSNKKQKKLRSEVWNDFEKYTDENGKDWAKCNICKKPFNGSSKMGTTHLKNHFKSCSKNKSNEGGGSASGDKPAEDSVMDQQLNHLDKSNYEGGGSASGDKPAENSVMDPQLNRLDMVKMLIKQWHWITPFLNYIEAADLINLYKEEKEKLRIYFEKLPCRLSLMINMDQSVCKECICFRVYFIDDDWKLKEKIISWKCIGGDTIMKILKNVLSEWGIDNNISYMVLDGYSYDHVLSSNERENEFSSQGSLLFNGKLSCIRDFNDIGAISSWCLCEILYDRMKEIFKYITGNGNFRIAIDRATSLGKKVTTEVIPTEQDVEHLDAWELVEDAWGLKEAFFELENMESEFKSINLTKEEWDLIPTICAFTDDETLWYDFTDEDTFYYDYKTANMYFPWICNIYTISLESGKLKPSIYEKESFHYLRDRMKCWYDDNLVLAVAAVLDPRFRLNIVKHWYKKIYGDECDARLAKFMDYLTSVYNEYAKGTNNFQSAASGSKEKESSISYEMLDPSGQPRKHHQSPNTELPLYLEDVKFPLIRDFNILDWWRSNTEYFPTLAEMARDFLSIKITIPVARFFFRNSQTSHAP
ncbi:hypothetical protein LWI29_009792 [Acer saccharum]|uniref:BED-type domain-containing protein n=1 Tax=Acer saccharum TaxID=4024 RepID=A0AA39RPK6_ACESA|nr:hypothetical protein LWI29_009792 [Acer saccharum]